MMQSIARTKVDFKSAWKRIPWKKILIGDVMRIDIMRLGYQQAYDIVLCGILGAFSLLIAVSALALPAEIRVVVWLGSVFALVAAVDRQSWKPVLRLPLIVIILSVGAVTLSARLSGYPASWVVYAALRYGLAEGLGFSLGMLVAFMIAEFVVSMIASALRVEVIDPAQRAEAKAIRHLLKQSLGLRVLWSDTRSDGAVVFFLGRRSAQRLVAAEVEQWLNRPVEFRPRKHWYQDDMLLVFPPRTEVIHDQPTPMS